LVYPTFPLKTPPSFTLPSHSTQISAVPYLPTQHNSLLCPTFPFGRPLFCTLTSHSSRLSAVP
jgi:hypothetical protein